MSRYKGGRERWKRIKRLARAGAIEAFQSWSKAKRQHEQIAKLSDDGLANIVVWYLGDRAAAVRMARPTMSKAETALVSKGARHTMVNEHGIEMTQDDFDSTLDVAVEMVRAGLEAKGTPMPAHPEAARELLRWIYKGARP